MNQISSLLLLLFPLLSFSQAPPNATILTLTSYPEALCLDGSSAFVYVSLSPTQSTQWVFNFGASPELTFCIDLKSCMALYDYMVTQTSPPSSFLLPGWGVQSRNCIDNPDFCNANHVSNTHLESNKFFTEMTSNFFLFFPLPYSYPYHSLSLSL